MDKKYNAQETEQLLTTEWEKHKIYKAPENTSNLYSIDTPPPTVSGSLHIGHIFSYTQTDVIARYQRMNGKPVFYPFGFDDNGLPTERYVEKKCKVRAHDLGRSKFIQLCLEQTQDAEKEFKSLWQRMGLSVDWSHWYSTISKSSRRISQLSFLKLYNDGFVYRKEEPALYCTVCRTTVAQAELDDIDQSSFFNDIVFKDEDGNDLVIGTTRPELLYSTGALLYHPSDKRYTHLKNKKAIVPIYGHEIPIYEDEDVVPEKGTGLVMVSTFGDQQDIVWFKKFDLPLRLSIGRDGKWLPETGIITDMKAIDARKTIIEELKTNNLLVDQRPISHTVNVHERCKKEIEYITLTQWFIKIIDYKDEFIKIADTINWHPTFMKSRYLDWVSNIKWDWCISRQRMYGIPFPVWHCQSCSAIVLADEKDLPIDPQETNAPKACSCGSTDLVADTDVMDTWNTSSITPYINYNLLHPDKDPFCKDALEFLPMGMRPQAHDIIRTWAFYTIIKVWMHNKTIPWKDIVISGHVLSSSKEKLSKSKGNDKLAPETLLKQYSADAIRYWTASGTLGHDVSFSDTQLKIGQKLITKLWNAFKFSAPHLKDFKPTHTPKELGAVNEWILTSASKTFTTYDKYFANYEFGLALNTVEHFFWHDYCDNYIELVKHQLFNPEEYDADTIYATQWTLYHLGLRILQLYSPYVPYITDTLYKHCYSTTIDKTSIHQTTFIEYQTPYSFDEAYTAINGIIALIAQVRKLKSEHQLSLKAPVQTLTIHTSNENIESFKSHEKLLKGITHAETITYSLEPCNASELIKKEDSVTINLQG